MDGAVKFDRVTINRETNDEEIATGVCASMRGEEIRCIGMIVKYHI